MKDSFKFNLFSIICIIILCIGCTIRSYQNDTFYIIKLGDYIVHHGIDNIDHYSWVFKLSYTYPHWLYDIFVYYIYHYFGYFGIYLSNIFLFIVLILVIYFVHLKFHKNYFLAFFISLLSISCLYAFVTARAQLMSILIFILEVYFIEMLLKSGKNRYIVYLIIGSLVVANIHGTAWLMYFILFMPYIGEYIIYNIFQNKTFRDIYKLDKYCDSKVILKSVNNIKKIFISFIFCFLMGLFTPSRICYSYTFRIMMGDSQSYIVEHAPMVIIHNPCFIAVVFVFLLLLIFTDVKVYLRELLMISGLILMSLISVRHLLFFYTIALLYISIICVRALEIKNDKTLNVLMKIIINNKIVFCFILVIITCFSFYKYNENKRIDFVPKDQYPVDAVGYIKDNLDYKNIKLYNEYNDGSYLLFNDIPVFADSRCDLYLKEFNNMKYSIFDDYINMYKKYEKRFKYYGVEYVLIPKKDILYKLLSKDSFYQILYKDKYYALFRRISNE